jgi:hypothetical protein
MNSLASLQQLTHFTLHSVRSDIVHAIKRTNGALLTAVNGTRPARQAGCFNNNVMLTVGSKTK